MKKIIYMTAWPNDATAYYRLLPLEHINHPDLKIERKPYYGDITFSTFIGYDVLVMERPSTGNDIAIIKLAKQCGLRVICDYDDDILHVDPYNPMYHDYEEQKQNIIDGSMEADEVWVSTPGIAHSFRFYTTKKPVIVIPNAHSDYVLPIANKKPFNHKTKKAIWRGGASHEADVYGVAEDLLKIINDNKDWQFQFIGYRFIFLEQRCGDNYLPVYPMPLMQYFGYMADENPNVVFFPLADNLLNKSKSNISWLEATYCGAAYCGDVQDTECPPFNRMIFGQEVPTSFLHLSPSDLEFQNRTSWQRICDEFLLSKVNQTRIERLEAI